MSSHPFLDDADDLFLLGTSMRRMTSGLFFFNLIFLTIDANPVLSWTGIQGLLAGLSQCHSKLGTRRSERLTKIFSALVPRKASHLLSTGILNGPWLSDSGFMFFVFLFEHM